MTFEQLVVNVNLIINEIWLKDETYIARSELHNRLLLMMNLPTNKQNNAKFCKLLKAAIKASIICREVTIDGYLKYKRI